MDFQKALDQMTDLNRLSTDAERTMNAHVIAFERLGETLVEMVKAQPYLQATPLGQALIAADRARHK